MKLYYMPRTIAVAVAIALEEAGLPYETELVDFKENAQTKAPYRAVNPNGRVPALAIDDTTVLTETGAILEYIHALSPATGLIPTDPLAAARVREAMYYFASTMHINHAHKTRGPRWATLESSFEDMKAKVPETMTASCAHVEKAILTGPLIIGEQFTAADAYLYVISQWLQGDGVDLGAFPKLVAFRQAMAARPSVMACDAKGMLPA